MRRRLKIGVAVLVVLAAGVGTYYYTGAGPRPVEVTRSARLLTIAAEEAGKIDVLEERLARQLNIADLQIQHGQKSEAVKTLALAVVTLHEREKTPEKEGAKPVEAAQGAAKNDGELVKSSAIGEAPAPVLDEFRRIAGWTSVAELANMAGDSKMANEAYLEAVEALNSVQPETRRAEYVLSLAEICAALRGQGEAARLLVKGGAWAAKITDARIRRFALATFARKLTSYDNLDDARTVMRNELDARWRSDMFSALALQNIQYEDEKVRIAGNKSSSPSPVAAMEAERTRETRIDGHAAASTDDFNRNLHYSYNYRNEEIQRGMTPR